jgi:uncharacterized protein YceH (UPF0502 family)
MAAPLLPDECRVLGVLVEKAQTTPGQYPLTLNGVVTGCSQKNNRDPVDEFDEDRAQNALDGLRAKGLVRELSLEGSRVAKYRHIARETLAIDTPQLVLLAELLLRGPQTVGELRGRATRMHPLESLESVQAILESLATREIPLAKEIAPAPGSRAPRWIQLLCDGLHPLDRVAAAPATAASAAQQPAATMDPTLLDRVAQLERSMEAVLKAMRELGAEV